MKRANRQSVNIRETWGLTELDQFCDADAQWVITLVDHGALDPFGRDAGTWQFTAQDMRRAHQAGRLAREYGLNHAALKLVLALLKERNALARKVAQLSR
jgi:chaperone modulatory protein CbpM